MGPVPRENQNRSNEEYDDGWFVGYEVEMNGIGLVNVYEEAGEQSDSDGYEGPGDSDDENAAALRAGYIAIPSAIDTEVDFESSDLLSSTDTISKNSSQPLSMNVCPPVQKEFEKALDNATNVHLKDEDFSVDSFSSDIHLTQEKLEVIKSAMSAFSLKAPDWVNTEADDHILKFLRKHKESE